MKHPEILLLPGLMLLDYYGTLLGAIWIKRGYSDSFGLEHYEMNPVWQDSVDRVQWFNLRHLGTTAAMTVGSIIVLEVADYPSYLAHGFIGVLLGMYAMLVGRHISNVLTYRYVARHKDELSGRVEIAHPMMLRFSAAQIAPVAIPLGLVAALSRSAYVVGATIGVLGLLLSHRTWIRKAHRDRVAAEQVSASETTDPGHTDHVAEA